MGYDLGPLVGFFEMDVVGGFQDLLGGMFVVPPLVCSKRMMCKDFEVLSPCHRL